MIFGFGQDLALGRIHMAHDAASPRGHAAEVEGGPFGEIILRRRSTLELAAVACKRAPADTAQREALLAALEL